MGEILWRKPSNEYLKNLMLHCASQNNILPITSTCNVRCIFCSHRQNPPGIESYRIPPASLDEVEEMLVFIDRRRPVVIGESVTRIMEGEPFTHPRIMEILGLIRKKFPGTQIRITTNGNMLNPETVEFLASLENVVIMLSLNSSCPENRIRLMNDSLAGAAVEAPRWLSRRGVEYHGSVVAMPHVTGWDDLASTIGWLDHWGAGTVRVFLPGHTRYAPEQRRAPANLREELLQFLARVKSGVTVPVTVEPPYLTDLQAGVAGVMACSPAGAAGLRENDIILSVNNKKVLSRVDAFRRVYKNRDPRVEILRGNSISGLKILKKPGETSGLVMDYDLDPEQIKLIGRAVRRHRADKAVVMTSELALPVIKQGLEKLLPGQNILPVAVKNSFFGGSIGCAGLLVVEDMAQTLLSLPDPADLFILPAIAFDHRGRDLTGRSYLELAERCAGAIEVI